MICNTVYHGTDPVLPLGALVLRPINASNVVVSIYVNGEPGSTMNQTLRLVLCIADKQDMPLDVDVDQKLILQWENSA